MQHQKSLKVYLQALVVALAFIVGVTFSFGIEAQAASKLKVSPKSKTIYIGNKLTIKANKNVKWSVVNKKTNIKIVKKSSKKVTIKGVKAGTVYVKAKAGKTVKKVKIVVKSKAPSKINLVSSNDLVGVGNHCTVYVKSVEPSSSSDAVILSSSDEGIATIDQDGFVTGVEAGLVTITATSKYDKNCKASVTIKVVKTMKGTITMSVDLSDETKYPSGTKVEVWIPVAQSIDNQLAPASVVKWKAEKLTKAQVTTDSEGNRVVYMMWDETIAPEDRVATIMFHVSRQEAVCPDGLAEKEQGVIDEKAMAQYLKETEKTGPLSSGIVKEISDQIAKDSNAETVYQKVSATYEWVCENLMIDSRKPLIGNGDVSYVLSHLEERCSGSADVNETFVALCRAQGVPARCVYSIKLDALKSANMQQCWAQFYLPGYGWVDVNPCLALVGIKNSEELYRGENAKYASLWTELKERYWGSAPETCAILSLNKSMNLDFKYSYAFEQDVDDCGCD